jgi:UDP-2,4-diacetamido-2,4,6-trideoxy-beta-L-altropyranose hydrolase
LRIVIRVDASAAIATGHVMRCLTLASALRQRGAAVSFICREHPGHLCGLIEERGFPVSRLPAPRADVRGAAGPAHAAWLGASWEEDAEQTRSALAAMGEKPDWLVVDHYALDRRWESALRASAGRLMAIDDLADRAHDCDLLLDQNMVAKMHARYAGKVPEACVLLLGTDYALVQPIFAELRTRAPSAQEPVRRIFIYFGGVDSDNLTGRTLSAFIGLKRPDIEVDAVFSASAPHAQALRRLAAAHKNIHLHSGLLTLAPLMVRADVAVGAGGATSWERLCLGLRSIVVTTAENQRSTTEELARRDLICWLGPKEKADEAAFARELDAMIGGRSSRRCPAPFDGRGVDRVSAALTVTGASPLRVRYVKPQDEGLLLEWANDSETRRNSLSPDRIAAETHHAWFVNYLSRSDDRRLCIVETTDGVALGQVRFTRHEQDWEVHYAIGPAYRGRGLGRPLLEAALESLSSDIPGVAIFGRVKDSNLRSRRIFESLGFDVRPKSPAGTTIYQRTFGRTAAGARIKGK